MKPNTTIYVSIFFFFILLFFSCGPESSSSSKKQEPSDVYLTSNESLGEKKKEDIISSVNLAKLLGLNVSVDKIKQGINVYKIEYKTKYKGTTKIASALVSVPVDNADSYSVMVYNHGTIANDAESPTVTGLDGLQNQVGFAISSTGMVVVIPDYLGYGSSKDITHPYFIAEVTASTLRDAISATYELLQKKSVTINKKLYAMGYSEGGYATMVLHRSLEKESLSPFNFKASFPAAGGYDIISFRNHVVGLTTYSEPFFLGFVAKAYKTYYNFGEDFYSKFIKTPYDGKIDSLIDGVNSSQVINSDLSTKIVELLTPTFISNPDSIVNFKEKMTINSPIDFTPKIKMFMYHGRDDVTVPYNNSVAVKDKFISSGASSDIVIFKEISGDHNSGVYSYLNEIFEEISKLEKN